LIRQVAANFVLAADMLLRSARKRFPPLLKASITIQLHVTWLINRKVPHSGKELIHNKKVNSRQQWCCKQAKYICSTIVFLYLFLIPFS